MAAKSRSTARHTASKEAAEEEARHPAPLRRRAAKRKVRARRDPAWSRPRWRPLRTRCARRSPAFWRSAICLRPPTSTSANGAGSTPSRPARSIWRALRRCSSMPRGAAAPGLTVRQDFFDLRTLARNAGDSLTGRAAAKGLQSSVEISEKLPAFAVGDPVRLRAALENLIDNAVKFTDQRQRHAAGVAAARAPRARSASRSRSPTAASASRSARSSACSARSRRPMSRSHRASAAPGLGCRRSSSSRAPWAATSS